MSYPHRYLPWLAAASLVALAGCSNKEEPVYQFEGVVPSTLERAQSCSELESMLKADARSRMNKYIDLQISAIRRWSDRGGWGMDEAIGADSGAGPSGGAAEDGAGPAHSETNTQVEGVDEADIVKTDGERIFLLHGATLSVLDSWPIEEMRVDRTIPIEGRPYELFIEGDKAVVYSTVDANPVYTEAGKPLASSGRSDCGEYGDCGGYYYYYYPLTKITVLDLAAGAPVTLAEHYVEGSYVSARRIGTRVHTVVSGGAHEVFDLSPDYDAFSGFDWDDEDELIEAYERLRAKNERRISAASIDDLLPDRFQRQPGGAAAISDVVCQNVYVPTAGSTDFGVTQIHTLDLANAGATLDATIVFGDTATIYQNHDKLILASPSWSAIRNFGPVFETRDELASIVGTHLHVFALTDAESVPVYRASATVPGTLEDQFALDEKDGVVRVATTETLVSDEEWTSANDLFVLRFDGAKLASAGSIKNLAPGERIYSTRFVGDKAYMVTFRQIDPLFVIDTSVPESPALLGELKIPGFSEYMHPIEGGDYLLTIGVDADEEGVPLGVALQIFDVRNPLAPKLAHKLQISDDGWGWSEALHNHKAFTFYEGVLAIPVEGGYASDFRSGLGVFRVDVTTGIEELGRIDHSPYFDGYSEYNYCYYGYAVRRGLFIEDHVISVSEAAVVATPLANLATTTRAVELPQIGESCETYY